MLQLKNIKPNVLTNNNLQFNKDGKGIFSFEIEGNEDIDVCALVFKNLSLNPIIENSLTSNHSSDGINDGGVYDYPDTNEMGDLPDKISMDFSFKCDFIFQDNIKNYFGNYLIDFTLNLPYTYYPTFNASENYRSIGVFCNRDKEVLTIERNFVFNEKGVLIFSEEGVSYESLSGSNLSATLLKKEEEKGFTLKSNVLTLTILDNIKEEIGSDKYVRNFVHGDKYKINDAIKLKNIDSEDVEVLPGNTFFAKITLVENQSSFLSVGEEEKNINESLSHLHNLSNNKEGLLLYSLKPNIVINSFEHYQTWKQEIDKPYKTFSGKPNIFSFEIDEDDINLKNNSPFYITLENKNKKISPELLKGFVRGATIPSGYYEDFKDTKPGDILEVPLNRYTLPIPVLPGDKIKITSKVIDTNIPLINFYSSLEIISDNYIKSIYAKDLEENTVIINVPYEIDYSYIVVNSRSNYLPTIFFPFSVRQRSLLINYENFEKPKIKNLSLNLINEYDYSLSFDWDTEKNVYPMLWYQIKLYNINENNKIIIYDTNRIFTSVNQISIKPIHLLPNEKYQYEIQISNTQNIISTYISDEILETSKAEEVINFSEQSIKKYLSESFIKLELNKFGIYQQGIYPGITLFPEINIYPKDNTVIPSKYQKLKLLREDLVNKQAIWIDEKEWTNKEPSYSIYDYGIKANTPYNYWAYTIDENGILSGVKINNEPISAEWDRWTLVTADKDPENEKVYHVDKVFTFEMNLSSGSMTNGTNITTSKNFTEFPIV